MEFCLRLSLKDVHVFSDSSQEIEAISKVVDLGPNGVITKDIQSMFHSDMLLSIQYIRRMTNRVVHLLAP